MADNVDIQGLSFVISAKTDQSVSGNVDKFGKALKRMGDNSTKTSDNLQKLSEVLSNFDKTMGKAGKLGKFAEAMSNLGNVKISSSIANGLGNIGKAAEQLSDESIDKIKRLADSLKGLEGMKLKFNLGTDSVKAEKQQEQLPQVKAPGVFDKTPVVREFRDALSGVGSEIGNLLHRIPILGSVLDKMSGGFTMVKKAAQGLGSAIGSKLFAGVKAVTAGMGRMFIAPARNIGEMTGKFGQLLSSIKRIALYRAIRFFFAQLTGAIREGISNLYQYSAVMDGTFKRSMDSLASSFLYLKNSVGAMVAPLINALAPAVEYVIDKFVALLNIVNQFFSALTGKKTTTVAKRVATTYKSIGDGASDAAGNTSDAVKELKKSLLGFDELNILNGNTPSSGGGSGGGGAGGSAGPSFADMFETMEIDSGISDWANELKNAFENGDWETLGTMLGEKFNELVDDIPWSEFGRKVGYAMNGAISTAYYFFDTADFKNLGVHIGEFLNEALNEMLKEDDNGLSGFEKLGGLIVQPFTKIADTIYGVISELDTSKVAAGLSDFISGAFDELTKWLKSYDWSATGAMIETKLVDFFSGLKVSQVATSISTFLGAAIRAAAGLVGGFVSSLVEDIKDKLLAEWNKSLDNANGNYGKAIFDMIGRGIGSVAGWVVDNIITPFMRGLTNKENWTFPSLDEIGSKLWGAVKSAIGTVSDWVYNILIKPFIDAFSSKNNWSFPDNSSWFKEKIKNALGLNSDDWIKEIFTINPGSIFSSDAFLRDLLIPGEGTIRKTIEWVLYGKTTDSFDVVKKAWENITDSKVWKSIFGKKDSSYDTTKTSWGQIASAAAYKTIYGNKTPSFSSIQSAWESIKTKSATLTATVKTTLGKGWDKFKKSWEWLSKHASITLKAKFLDKAYSGLSSAWGKMARGYNSFRAKVNKYSSVFGIKLPGPLPTALARGGITTGTTQAIIGEAGKEAVLPLERNLGWQKTLAEQLVAKMGDAQPNSTAQTQMLYAETVRQNDLLAKQNQLLAQILDKDIDVNISTTSIQEGLRLKNLRDGKTVVPVY